MTRPQVQRLVADGHGLPDALAVDVGSIARWDAEYGSQGNTSVWKVLAEASARSRRQFVWVVAMPAEFPAHVFSTSALSATAHTLFSILPPAAVRVHSTEGFASLLTQFRGLGVVTAGIEQYREQVYVLDFLPAVLDIATGQVHTYPIWHAKPGETEVSPGVWPRLEPKFAPEIEAAVRQDPAHPRGNAPGGKRAARFRDQLDAALQAGLSLPPAAGIPSDVAEQLTANVAVIEARRDRLVGAERVDEAARATITVFLQGHGTVPTGACASAIQDPIVILPLVTGPNGAVRTHKHLELRLAGAVDRVVFAEPSVQSALRDLVDKWPGRWIAPRGLDLARYMLRHGIPLPERIFDPALGAYALDPDDMGSVVASLQFAHALPPDSAAWLWDLARKEPGPRTGSALHAVLPLLVADIEGRLSATGMRGLFRDDLELTLPVLARIEHQGAWVRSTAASAGERNKLGWALDDLERTFEPHLGDLHAYRAKPVTLTKQLDSRGFAVRPASYASYLFPGEVLKRMALEHAPARDLDRARTLISLFSYLNEMTRSQQLQGLFVPMTTGRFGYRSAPLNMLPKHFPEAKRARQLLQGPAGYALVGADFSSFELRLIAGLSRDPELLKAAQQRDAFQYLAEFLFGDQAGPDERKETKRHLHALNYGQAVEGFVGSNPTVPIAEAELRFDDIQAAFPTLFQWRTAQSAAAGSQGYVRTGGGWQRRMRRTLRGRKRENIVSSTLVQGLAADIFRWCVRELDKRLAASGMDAFIVFVNHDEIFIATRPEHMSAVEQLVRDVMEKEVANRTRLVPPGVTLVANIKNGTTWADLI